MSQFLSDDLRDVKVIKFGIISILLWKSRLSSLYVCVNRIR